MTRLAWKVFISSKACRLIVILRQEFIRHLFGKLLFPFVSLNIAISYKGIIISCPVCLIKRHVVFVNQHDRTLSVMLLQELRQHQQAVFQQIV